MDKVIAELRSWASRYTSIIKSYQAKIANARVKSTAATANAATETANAATETANPATETANPATETANPATETANAATETANAATETANPATETANAATETANAATEEAPKANYYTHPRASEVRLIKGTNAIPLNSDAELLLKSMLAATNQFSATYTSTLRTYEDQARIMITQLDLDTVRKLGYYGRKQDFLDDYARFRAARDQAGFAEYLRKRDKDNNTLISKHIPGYAIDIRKNSAIENYWGSKIGGSTGIKKILPEDNCTHIEFTFHVTGAGGSQAGGGGSAVPVQISKDGSIQGSVGRNGQNRANDVATIQDLLNKKANAGLEVDGIIGNKTINAIARYQQSVMNVAKPDGRVDVGGATWRSLTEGLSAAAQTDTVSEDNTAQNHESSETSNQEAAPSAPTSEEGAETAQNPESAETPNPESAQQNASTAPLNKDIKASVGQGGVNNPEDVRLIQSLLKDKGINIEITGNCDEATINAIKDYQKKEMGASRPDGRVDVNGAMWNHLHGRVIIPGAAGVLAKASNYDDFLKEAADRFGLKFSQLKSIMCTESGGNPNATSGSAFGLMQLTRITWLDVQNNYADLKSYAFNDANKYDPRINILFGAAALKLKAKYLNISPDDENFAAIGIIAYNAGQQTVIVAMDLARAAGSQNPIVDFLKPEYLKPAIESTGIYSYYQKHRGASKEEAIQLKYIEISGYAPKVNSYMSMQEQSATTP